MRDPLVTAELSRLYAEKRRLTPSEVIEAAKDEASPLHEHFEWDDTEAAREYRLHQARNLLRIYVVMEPTTGEKDQLVHVRTASVGEGEYHPMSRVVARSDWYENAEHDVLTAIAAAQRRLKDLHEAAKRVGADTVKAERASAHVERARKVIERK